MGLVLALIAQLAIWRDLHEEEKRRSSRDLTAMLAIGSCKNIEPQPRCTCADGARPGLFCQGTEGRGGVQSRNQNLPREQFEALLTFIIEGGVGARGGLFADWRNTRTRKNVKSHIIFAR